MGFLTLPKVLNFSHPPSFLCPGSIQPPKRPRLISRYCFGSECTEIGVEEAAQDRRAAKLHMQGADEATRHRAEYVLTEAWRTIQRIVTNYSKLRATFEAVNNLINVLLRRRIVELFKSTQNKVAKTFLFGSTFIKSHHHVYSPSPAAQHQQTPPSRPYCLCIITPSPHALHEQKKCAAPHLSSIISVC